MTRKKQKETAPQRKPSKRYDPFIEKTLCEMFPPEWLRETAKESGLVKRERKIDPVIMFWVLTLSFGVRLQRTLASLKRSYTGRSGKKVSDGSWYERFTPELVLFMKTCVMHGIEHFAQRENRRLSERLADFKDVLIQDNTVIRLHEALAEKWPATRSKKVAAGVKVSLLVSAVADGPKTVAIHGERTSDIKTLRIGPWVKDRILLIDLGFYKHHMFTKIKEYGGYFVSRLKDSADPLILSSNRTCRGNSIDVVGKTVSEVLPRLKRQVLDLTVEVPIKRRTYKGLQKGDASLFRLVAIYNEEEKKYHTYITNIDCEVLGPDEIASLYGARWEVELIFKELKSKYALDVVNTKNPQIVEAYIWTAILTLLVSKTVHGLVRRRGEKAGKKAVRFTQLRWSNTFSENNTRLLDAIFAHLDIEFDLMTIHEVYDSDALDPHVNRERFREEWWS